MGTYYGAVMVEKLGKPCSWYGSRGDQPPFDRGTRLVSVVDNGLYRIAADTTDRDEWVAMYASYAQGHWLTITNYQLTRDQLAQCPDTGRAYNRPA